MPEGGAAFPLHALLASLRALDATGVAPGALLRLALPSLVIAMLGALVL